MVSDPVVPDLWINSVPRSFERNPKGRDMGTKHMQIDENGESSVGLGLIGLGYWGPNHLRVVEESDRADLNWICDIAPDRLERFSTRTRASTTSEIDRVLGDNATDAVLISTPISTHYELGKRALEAGKHVLLEKPLAGNSVEVDELVSIADREGLAIMCGHTFLFSPPVMAIKEMIGRGDLGEIYFISSSRVNLGLHQRDGNVLWDLAPHDLSILLNWLEELPEWVSVVGRDSIVPDICDVAFANLGYASGLLANVELSWLAPGKLRRTVIVGNERMVVYDDTASEQVRIFDHGVVFEEPESFGEFQLSYRTGDILSPKLASGEPLSIQLNTFIDSIHAGSASPELTRIARGVVELIEVSERSRDEGGTRISLEEFRAETVA